MATWAFEFIDYQGILAMVLRDGWIPAAERPVARRTVWVSRIKADEFDILGQSPYFSNGVTIGTVRRNNYGGELIVDVRDWERVTEERPIPKPRDGKTYTWTWGGWSGWAKEWFPRCRACYEYHNPALPYCDECGRCHKGGRHHR